MKPTLSNSLAKLAAAAAAGAALTFGTAGLAAGPSFGHFSGMPSGAFHGAPRSFHGPTPHAGAGAPRPGRGDAGPDPGHFSGRSFDHFSAADQGRWSRGAWRHERRDGRLGWWWVVDGLWYSYDQPSYPYPTDIGPDADDGDTGDDAQPAGALYCEDPPGYYPDVPACNAPWEPVAPQ